MGGTTALGRAGAPRIEAVATAAFGSVLGTLLGPGPGVALQHGLRAEGLITPGIAWTLVLVMLGASLVVGVVAAVAPALRAARLDILRPIASD
ncbi:MAG: hypothetical protein LH468_06005 [Nocardioides sp.]|nr:hypothetical protein [Nocardioides sp.]